jgi:hypothetical protein
MRFRDWFKRLQRNFGSTLLTSSLPSFLFFTGVIGFFVQVLGSIWILAHIIFCFLFSYSYSGFGFFWSRYGDIYFDGIRLFFASNSCTSSWTSLLWSLIYRLTILFTFFNGTSFSRSVGFLDWLQELLFNGLENVSIYCNFLGFGVMN